MISWQPNCTSLGNFICKGKLLTFRVRRLGKTMNYLKQDVLFAGRQLFKSPVFTIVAVTTLALGIGANTAFFGVLNATIFRPLPYPQASQLVHISERAVKGDSVMPVSYPNFVDWKRQQTSFSAITIYRTASSVNLATGTGTDRMSTVMVDHDFIKVLGFQPMLGRDLTAADDRTGAPLTVLLTHATWSRRFNEDQSVIGRAVQIDGKSATIVGVLPENFQFFSDSELVLPLGPFVEQFFMQTRNNHSNATVLGRLKPGVSLTSAKGEMDSIAARLGELYPKSNIGVGVTLMGLHQYLMSDARQRQLLLMGAVGLVLLIVCVNIATLSLARSCARDREMAIRAALGADRPRLVRQLMVESFLLAAIGGCLGLFVAAVISATLNSLVPFQLLQLSAGSVSIMDFRVEAFALTVTLLTGIGFGLVPAWQLSRANPNDVLKDRSAAAKSFGGGVRTPDLLVVAQVASATLLLVTAGLILRSLWSLSSRPLGYEPENVLSLHLASPGARVEGNPLRVEAFYQDAVDRLAQLPGVESAAATSNLAFDFNDSHNQFRFADGPAPSPADYPSASFRIVTRDYFRAMGIPLHQGRFFSGQEPMPSLPPGTPSMPQILESMHKLPMDAIVTRSFAQRWWPGQDAVGKSLILGPPNLEIAHMTVIGVVGDSSQDSLSQTDHEEFYVSLRQFPFFPEYGLLMRTRGNPAVLIEAAKTQMRQMTATEAVYDVRPLSLRIASSISTNGFQSKLISAFAAVALVLASVGLYGVLAFNVGRRSREIGIRMALGASRNSVVGNVFFRGFAMVIPGLAVGLVGAWMLAHYLQNQLFEVSASDPGTYAVGAVTLLLSALRRF
jgi:putative ABC transport system permease protein